MKLMHFGICLGALALAAGCATDEKTCLPPDADKAELATRYTFPYSETLWHLHYHKDERKVPVYTLPQFQSKSVKEWEQTERPRILAQFKEYLYGRMPPKADHVELKLLAQKDDALDGLAVRKEYRIFCRMDNGRKFDFDMLVYVPKNAKTPPPVFVGLNFSGNQANTPELDVRMTRGMYRSRKTGKFMPLSSRARFLDSWNFKETVKRGYAVATACYWEICPDFMTGLKISPFAMFYPERDLRMDYEIPKQESKACKWHRPVGMIGAWSWGLSCMLDALEQEPLVDAGRAAVIGHSRLGKAALWAGACDRRFKLVISNNSGCGGAALTRRLFGETMEITYWEQRNWYCGKLAEYCTHVENLPVDQHMLLALVAPRALYVASATQDLNADPKGEFLAAAEATKIWHLYGLKGLEQDKMPKPDTSVGDRVGYHIRTGKHAITGQDWEHYYNFADRIFGMKKP